MPAAEPETVHRITLPTLGPVAAEIAATAALGRNEAVAALKAIRAREFAVLHRHLIEHINETTGLDIVLTISALTDAIVRALVERAMQRVAAPANWAEHSGIFAIGGYGRGEMNPHSDLDLLMLDVKPGVGWADQAWAELNTLLWDVKFQVGASHRSAPEMRPADRGGFRHRHRADREPAGPRRGATDHGDVRDPRPLPQEARHRVPRLQARRAGQAARAGRRLALRDGAEPQEQPRLPARCPAAAQHGLPRLRQPQPLRARRTRWHLARRSVRGFGCARPSAGAALAAAFAPMAASRTCSSSPIRCRWRRCSATPTSRGCARSSTS